MRVNKVKTEVWVGAVLVIALTFAILTVVGFGKTMHDLEKIEKAVNEKQKLLKDGIKEAPPVSAYSS
ncbi:MAG: hypothetical protein RBS77_00380 [Candidatus Moranbacteria bacterium]|jgi:hypothetical protein|nr:hypothetical protein [Candidatus Moranbacteria bacterium]